MSIDIKINARDFIDVKKFLGVKKKYKDLDIKVKKCANIVKDEISKVVPIDTGELRRSLTVVKNSDLNYKVATNCEYAMYVEFGTGSLGDRTAPSHIKFSDEKYWVSGGAKTPKSFMRKGSRNAVPKIKKMLNR